MGTTRQEVRFGEEEQSDEPEVTSTFAEVRTGRGSAGFVRGGDEKCWADEASRKGKGEGNGGKGEHEGKRRKIWQQRNAAGDEDNKGRRRSQERKRQRKGEQQLNEEKEDILRLLRGWRTSETSPTVR